MYIYVYIYVYIYIVFSTDDESSLNRTLSVDQGHEIPNDKQITQIVSYYKIYLYKYNLK